MNKKLITLPCAVCKKPVTRYKCRLKTYKVFTCNKFCRAKYTGTKTSGEQNGNFKRGYTIGLNGYIYEQNPTHPLRDKKGRVLQHRRIAFDFLGFLPEKCILHHIDGNKLNNSIDNLSIWFQNEHIKQIDPLLKRYGKKTLFRKMIKPFIPLREYASLANISA